MAIRSQVIRSGDYADTARRYLDLKARALHRGLVKGAAALEREAQSRVPVDEGNLRRSRFTDETFAADLPSVVFGYAARYARWVHENIEQKWKGRPRRDRTIDGKTIEGRGEYWDTGEPRWLANAFDAVRERVRKIIAREVGK